MAVQGGVRGVANDPSPSAASGLWGVTEVYEAVRSNVWPLTKPVVSGGSLTSDATFYYRTFTGTGSLVLDGGPITSFAVMAVGGGGGTGGVDGQGGGGGGGVRNFVSAGTITPGTYTVTVGAGGAGSPSTVNGTNGSDSSALSIVATGGGYGGDSGGSGGSGGGRRTGSPQGLGNTPATSPSQGNNGGNGTFTPPNYSWGGGGGAGAAGGDGSGTTGGAGGVGVTITPVINAIVGAGGAGVGLATSSWQGRAGPTNGGSSGTVPTSGAVNRGGGAGGGGAAGANAASGGSGIVIIRYLKSDVD